ncbi:MAG: GH32 C-terminal domain-containing protein [Prevotella sp.]|nr:GH32 C-terminal domain-containing protein [Prevotella sp.]
MTLRNILLIALTAVGINALGQTTVAHFDMSLTSGSIVEQVSNKSCHVSSQLPASTIAGISGEALRFDGYSNYVKAGLPTSTLSSETLTMNVVLAAEAYPMMQVDVAETTPTYATICGNLDEGAKRGFALQLSSQGDLRLQTYVNYGGGYLVTVDGSEKLPRGRWCLLTMTFDKAGNAVTLWLNGRAIGTKKSNKCDLLVGSPDFYIGKDATDKKFGPFLINTFCGAIDDISISNEVVDYALVDLVDFGTLPLPDFSYPTARYDAISWRPQFHGMPSGSWTNESHGMVYSGGRYHLFFQKNANGPYMSRLHWGHISSKDLCEWTEEPIAIYPGEPFDIKGCWSGCVYEQGADTYILYTAVDNERARIVQAKAQDKDLVSWGEKKVIIDGRPSGLSDDFRDPYWFEANGRQYVIVGTSKNGIGACTLHRYENGTWSNDGSIFFQGTSTAQHGTFWEMPNVTPMGQGQYLFTCTPLNTGSGVRTLCWVGTIGSDGTFSPLEGQGGALQYLEMGGISRDGFGLLSPTICQQDGKTVLLGIVPDKLPTDENFKMGWAHNFSLPRQVSLAADGSLVQKPYSGLKALRTATATEKQTTLNGSESLSPVAGRHLEMQGEFTVGSAPCGFRFLKAGDRQASLSYDPATGILTLDYTTLARVSTDGGKWSAALPRKVSSGERLLLHVFFDGSIADIFVNDTWAFSVRLFPTDAQAVEAEVFADGPTAVSAKAWVLDAGQAESGIDATLNDRACTTDGWCCDLLGRHLSSAPQKGLYLKNGKKYVNR